MIENVKGIYNSFEVGEITPENLTSECVEGFAAVYQEAPDSIKRLSSFPGEVGARARLAKSCFEYLNIQEGMI